MVSHNAPRIIFESITAAPQEINAIIVISKSLDFVWDPIGPFLVGVLKVTQGAYLITT